MGNRSFCSGSTCSTCQKALLHPGGDLSELYDDVNDADPAGAVFTETLEDLSEIDGLLLVFSSSSNLAAVRWLFVLGASSDACDANGTTCLHAACRSGTLPIVRELIKRELPLNATDAAGWTPLHVALFMGRRGIALHLMQSGADLAQRNTKGLTPQDLCSDVWLREAISSCAAHRHHHGAASPWHFVHEKDKDVQKCPNLRFEPFFVPRAPVLKDLNHTPAYKRLGIDIFNQQPGQGLAFLVATGCVRDFPSELGRFLSKKSVSLTQLGEFMGKDFSLSQTLRLEYFNSVPLTGTGVVACLAKVFEKLHMPSDLQKIDRIIVGIAQIWWRKHEQLHEKEQSPGQDRIDDLDPVLDGTCELEGLELMRHLAGYPELHQVMFSAVLLHWNLHDRSSNTKRITSEQWLAMNSNFRDTSPEDLDGYTSKVLEHIHSSVYNTISRAFLPQLQLWSNGGGPVVGGPFAACAAAPMPPASGAEPVAEVAPAGASLSPGLQGRKPGSLVLSEEPIEGWGVLAGGGLPSLVSASGTIAYQQIRSILNESSSASLFAAPVINRIGPSKATGGDATSEQRGLAPPGGMGSGNMAEHWRGTSGVGKVASAGAGTQGAGTDRVWLTLRHALLLLSTDQNNWAPYAFVYLGNLVVQGVDESELTITLVAGGAATRPAAEGALDGNGSAKSQIELVFLLPDGRWQVLDIPHLKVQLPDARQLDRWSSGLSAHCGI